ncbi:hypothetical protein LCGC14_2266220 [marine sediment metagenome]|uniref:Uncharacterized protein n=1 Tax=marine sediment metagenome TaxID=412755 RepID=A0A0F9FAM3_9ZZZZ
MWPFKRKAKTIDVETLAEGLHGASLDAYSYPAGGARRNCCRYDWDDYRRKVARELLERYDILPNKKESTK